MRTIRNTSLVLAALAVLFVAGAAGAEESSINGVVQSIDIPSRTVVVKDYFGSTKAITIGSEDAVTMKKFTDGVIKVNDDVRVRYVVTDGKNVATFFRKSAGC